ncbi:MAG: 2Fe-2S iron-sulfur cluster binding domain-containing protein [Candidatus Binataceae bacterium]|nr:2Fe-2S iron-sulfur cluster binding domain-containing protein [Candidatus Binataceae bacterium]
MTDLRSEPASAQAHEIILRFEDGVEKRITVAAGEYVLDAALRQEIALVHQCRSGSCSTCVAQMMDGDLRMDPSRAHSLIPAEIVQGRRLLCSTLAHADSSVRLDYPSDLLEEAGPKLFSATVEDAAMVSDTVVRLVLKAPRGIDFAYHSGQYVRVKVPGTDQWRSYSMASLPRDLPKLEFLIRLILGGAMSEYLTARCEPGDEIEVEGPLGAFILRESPAPHVFVAGGTGVAPIISMLDSIRRRSGVKPPMLLSFGCASDSQFFYRDEVELRAAWMPQLRLRLSADRVEDPASGLVQGNPVQVLTPEDAADPDTVAYLCGPPPMIEAARRRLNELGVDPEHIYAEQFVAS